MFNEYERHEDNSLVCFLLLVRFRFNLLTNQVHVLLYTWVLNRFIAPL